jgi:hypothetical protein
MPFVHKANMHPRKMPGTENERSPLLQHQEENGDTNDDRKV